MKDAQKFVFVSLLVVLALQFSSFSKLKTIWGMAFNAAGQAAGKLGSNKTVTPPAPPTVNV